MKRYHRDVLAMARRHVEPYGGTCTIVFSGIHPKLVLMIDGKTRSIPFSHSPAMPERGVKRFAKQAIVAIKGMVA